VFTETTLPVRSVICPSGSIALTAWTNITGVITPVICPLPSTARDCRISNSVCTPASPFEPTTIGVGKFTVTEVVCGLVLVGLVNVPFSVVTCGGLTALM
jgi:hypothetical protein